MHVDGFDVPNIFNALERVGVGDAGDVDGFTVPIFGSMEREEVGDEGDVDGFLPSFVIMSQRISLQVLRSIPDYKFLNRGGGQPKL